MTSDPTVWVLDVGHGSATVVEKVLRWMGYEEDLRSGWWMKHGETHMRADDQQDGWSSPIDANWITGTLIPALATLFPPKWGMDVFHGWDEAPVLVFFFGVGMETLRGTGPTFEAAVISAAAKAVRNAER